ncbi:unnamed protein product [Leuciscus chuanchicus]
MGRHKRGSVLQEVCYKNQHHLNRLWSRSDSEVREVIHHGTVQIQCPTQVNYLAIIARSTTRSNIPQSITDLRDIHQLLTAATIK